MMSKVDDNMDTPSTFRLMKCVERANNNEPIMMVGGYRLSGWTYWMMEEAKRRAKMGEKVFVYKDGEYLDVEKAFPTQK